jgi:radical SAM superfamily enzyme YgiQ (UPF0313 family)
LKILLIYPYCLDHRIQEDDIRVVPLGLYYIGALLKEHGYDIDIINFFEQDKTPDAIEALLKAKQPDVIGLSVLNANRWGAIDIARIAKNINPSVHIVFGGVSATFLWKYFLTHHACIDYIVLGEGEYPFLNLIQALQSPSKEGSRERSLEALETIPGLAFRKNGQIIRNSRQERITTLDQLPNPARYFRYQHLSLSRGCPGNCTFCGSPQFWNRQIYFHSADYFVDQLTLLYQQGITFFFVSDDTFTLKKKRVIEICRKILDKGLSITWVAISRVNLVDEEILCWMRMAGCIQISYGVESGSETIRKKLNKQIRTDQIKSAFDLTVRYGILARAYFIYGCPDETWDTIQETIDLMLAIKPLSVIFYILDIFPGTQLYDDYCRRFDLDDEIWHERIEDILYFETDAALSNEQVLAFGKKLRETFHQQLPSFAKSIELVDNREMAPLHADFLSKLGMTFVHGDYAHIEAIPDKEKTAETLYRRALTCHPDHRAFWGLGMLLQKQGRFQSSAQILKEGLIHYPDSQPLNMCRGISLLNLGNFQKAVNCFLIIQHAPEALPYIIHCYQALGQPEKARDFIRKMQSMKAR